MKLKELLKSVPYLNSKGNMETEVFRIEMDSRKVQKGDLFVCIKGETVDGHNYIKQALEKGASVILVEKDIEGIEGNIVKVSNTVRALSQLSGELYGHPTSKMEVIGVTGTNGKTSITHFLNQMYKQQGVKTGLIGTMYHEIDGEKVESVNTTPFANQLQEMFYKMQQREVQKVFMEVSSHALAMGRVWGVDFKHAIFSNLTQDHLDYHGTMENYKQTKGLLFTSLGNGLSQGKTAIFNADDQTSDTYIQQTGAWVLTYGIKNEADVRALNIRNTSGGLLFDVEYRGEVYSVQTKIVGLFNVYNLLAVISFCLTDSWSMEDIVSSLANLDPVKGRLEALETNGGFSIVIDYAHTPDGLENALKSIKEITKGNLITVMGCGGDRDRIKRPIMAHIAEQHSDFVILTSDNPRTEEPLDIIKEMSKGMQGNAFAEIVDREEAISFAIKKAHEGDVVAIVGKGHEEYQIIGNKKFPFSDLNVAKKYL